MVKNLCSFGRCAGAKLAGLVYLSMLTLGILPGGCVETTGKARRGNISVSMWVPAGPEGRPIPSGQLVLKRGQTQEAMCGAVGVGSKISLTYYTGNIQFRTECTDGVKAVPSQWEMQMSNGKASPVKFTITIADDAPLGEATIKLIGTKEDDLTDETVYKLRVVNGPQTTSARSGQIRR